MHHYHRPCLALLFAAFFCGTLRGAAGDERMNILFIMSDDHSYQAMGSYDSRLASLNPTPNLDRFAKSSIVFDQAFCSNSICTPSRATVMTGQYSHRNGVYDLYTGLAGDRHYLSREMQKAGYQTAVIGKWHLKHSPEFFDSFSVIPGQGVLRALEVACAGRFIQLVFCIEWAIQSLSAAGAPAAVGNVVQDRPIESGAVCARLPSRYQLFDHSSTISHGHSVIRISAHESRPLLLPPRAMPILWRRTADLHLVPVLRGSVRMVR
jgi:hypothetical protein